MDALARLRKAAHDIARSHGMTMSHMLVEPPEQEGGSARAHVFLLADDNYHATTDPAVDADFQRVIDEAAAAERVEKEQTTRESLEALRDNLNRPDGFL